MDETEYRQTYRVINERKCIFEKSINARRCNCSEALRFNLADREGVACNSEKANETCRKLLEILRLKASFALHMAPESGPLPHAREIKVQTGGMLGIQHLLHSDLKHPEQVDDIHALIVEAIALYHSLEELPYSEIVKSIVKFQGRLRKNSRKS